MVNDIVNLVVTATEAVSGWMVDIFNATEAGFVFLGIICVVMSIRFFLVPAFGSLGSLGSDLARNRSKEVNGNE